MPARRIFTDEQIEDIKTLVDQGVPKYKIAEQFETTPEMLNKAFKERGIVLKSMRICTCVVCGNEFKASHKSMICPKCKDKPAKCVICGNEFILKHPYTQKTCSPECRGKYRAQSGIAKAGATKMKQTKMDRYGTLDPAKVTKARRGGELAPKECEICHKIFIPSTPRQIYCTDTHYAPCPVCGKPTVIKDLSSEVTACSEACRLQRIYKTNIERYGCKDAVNSEHARKLAKVHNLEKYGKEHYAQTDEFKERYKQTSLEKYGTGHPMQNKELQDKARKTSQERYGVDYYIQTEEGKQKYKETCEEKYGGIGLASPILRERITATNRENLGVDFPLASKEVQEKIHQNSLEKNGTYWPAVSAEANEKRKVTNLEKYGAENPFGSKEIQGRIHEKWTEIYGGPNPMCDPEIIKLAEERRRASMIEKYGAHASVLVPKIKEKIHRTMQERYGVDWYVQAPECMEHNYHAISKPNEVFAACLSDLGIQTTFEYYIGRPSFDLHIVDTNVLIEIDPTYSHNSFDNIWHEPKDKNYHKEKTKLAEDNGFRCIHVFDWDNKEAIVSMILPKEKIYARKCQLMEIDRKTAEQFTNLYHLQGSCRGQNIVYGLYYEGELVQMMSFGKPRYNKHYDLELLRLCTKVGVEVVGGASRLFKKFLKDYPDTSVLSYCDSAKFSGKVYEAIGMKFSHLTPPAKVWSKGTEYITDNYLRQRGYDQLFNANYGKGTSNEQLMLEHGWLPVFDCGQKVFVYEQKAEIRNND